MIALVRAAGPALGSLGGVSDGHYLAALGLTLLVEVPVYTLLLVSVVRARASEAAAAGVAVNVVSHPVCFLVLTPSLHHFLGPVTTLGAVEVIAWIGEALLLAVRWRGEFPALLAISYVANATSLSVGLLLLR